MILGLRLRAVANLGFALHGLEAIGHSRTQVIHPDLREMPKRRHRSLQTLPETSKVVDWFAKLAKL